MQRQLQLRRAVREDGWHQTKLGEEIGPGMKYLFGQMGAQSGAEALPRFHEYLTSQ